MSIFNAEIGRIRGYLSSYELTCYIGVYFVCMVVCSDGVCCSYGVSLGFVPHHQPTKNLTSTYKKRKTGQASALMVLMMLDTL